MIQDIRTIKKKDSKWNTIQIKEKGVWKEMKHVNENEKKEVVKTSLIQKLKNLFK